MRFVFFIVAAVVVIVAGVVVLRLNQTPPEPPPVAQAEAPKEVNIETVDVLVARSDIQVGAVVDNSMVDVQPWPKHLVLNGFITNAPESGGVVGKIVRSPIQAREPFIKTKLANPNDPGFLAAGLPAGMRAITISIDSITGVGGYVFPGDHVDVLFTHNLAGGDKGQSSGKASVSEVVAPNVRVISVGERAVVDPNSGGAKDAASAKSVTVEVSEEFVQRIRLAEKNGFLSLVLRSIKDDNSNVPSPSTLSELSKVSGGAGMLIVRGPGGNGNGKITATEGLSSDDSAGLLGRGH